MSKKIGIERIAIGVRIVGVIGSLLFLLYVSSHEYTNLASFDLRQWFLFVLVWSFLSSGAFLIAWIIDGFNKGEEKPND